MAVSIAAANSGIVMKTIQYQLRRKKCGAFDLFEFSFSFILLGETFSYECTTKTANPPLSCRTLLVVLRKKESLIPEFMKAYNHFFLLDQIIIRMRTNQSLVYT
jgi:hypothetical protein